MRPAYYALVVVAIVRWVIAQPRGRRAGSIRKAKSAFSTRNSISGTGPRYRLPPRQATCWPGSRSPRIHISVMAVEGDQAANLEHAVGHIPGTAIPGERGNVAFAAHRDTYFRPLAAIYAGDSISVATLQGTYRYQVVSTKIVRLSDVSVLYPTGRDAVTLVTCYPLHYVGAVPMRFIVQAVPLP
jgi:LPXTG-site transpeptidase (sortase) family protein